MATFELPAWASFNHHKDEVFCIYCGTTWTGLQLQTVGGAKTNLLQHHCDGMSVNKLPAPTPAPEPAPGDDNNLSVEAHYPNTPPKEVEPEVVYLRAHVNWPEDSEVCNIELESPGEVQLVNVVKGSKFSIETSIEIHPVDILNSEEYQDLKQNTDNLVTGLRLSLDMEEKKNRNIYQAYVKMRRETRILHERITLLEQLIGTTAQEEYQRFLKQQYINELIHKEAFISTPIKPTPHLPGAIDFWPDTPPSPIEAAQLKYIEYLIEGNKLADKKKLI